MSRELAHRGVTELVIVGSMHEWKAKTAEMSDAFIAMPGGFGTFEEFCEIVTWAQLGLHRKPCAILNVQRYYDQMHGSESATGSNRKLQSAANRKMD